MKGSTHLAIGGAIGVAACLYYPFHWSNALMYLSVAGVSAFSADLDGQNLLSSKLSKMSRWLRELSIWAGLLIIAFISYAYFSQDQLHPLLAAIGITLSLLGFVTKEGTVRNALVSLIGCALLYGGWTSKQDWLIEFGLFVAWVPWLDHRGMTHTLWAVVLWGVIGMGLEKQLGIDGIMIVAVTGYASHLLADSLTPNGVKWLYPLIR
jgi:inner membrane protein